MSDQFDYEGVFDDATIDDFLRPTSARAEVARTNRGFDAFNQFVEEQLRAVRTAWISAETYMQPLAIVANHESQRIFIPDDDETMSQFVDRMHREAKAMSAIWTFVATRTLVGSLGAATDDEEDIDLNDQEEIEKALAAGILSLGVMWYAERREDGNRHHRHGQMADENGTLGEMREGAGNQKIPLFPAILGD